jgi:transposase-like protein
MKHYSVERKAAVLRKMLPPLNLSVAELAQQEGISDGTPYHWRKQAMAGGRHECDEQEEGRRLVCRVQVGGGGGDGTAVGGGVEPVLPGEGNVFRAEVKAWKQACLVGQQTASQRQQTEGAQARADQKRIHELERELHRKDKALAEAAAILILRKKLNALWGDDTGEN